MLPANVISALQVLSNSGKPLATATPNAPKPVTNLELGQQLQGAVQDKISEGLFRVQVAGQTLQMRLPGNIQSGDAIRLQVISLQPKITFGMVASTNPLSTPEQIGTAARLLSNLAERPIERPVVQQLGNKAVWSAEQQVPDTKLLAGGLRETLGKSGLFYESHQAQWVRGERSINQLLEEPQNLLTGKALPLSAADQRAVIDKISTAQMQADIPAQAKVAGDTAQPIAKELVNLVQQQLHTLEQHHLAWMGQVWPGQQMQWEIQGQPERQPRQQQDERQWSTEMELALPRLGDVHARLVFTESGLRMTLRAVDPATVNLFNRALPGLKNSLTDAGIALAAAVVEKS
ncbi:MAG: flagellar hook-length control protein FliK [Gallionella sp.]|nr:flagellar hook-length control protein FliK [Gallionella sp.]